MGKTTSLVDLDCSCHIALLDIKFLLCSPLCSYRAGTREVHNKLEKNRWVQPVYNRASLKRERERDLRLFVLLHIGNSVLTNLYTAVCFSSVASKPYIIFFPPEIAKLDVFSGHY